VTGTTALRIALTTAVLLVAGCSHGRSFDTALEACSDRATSEVDAGPGAVWEGSYSDEAAGGATTAHVDGSFAGQDYHCTAHQDGDGWRVTEFGPGEGTSTPSATPTVRPHE
jgi:hypothetical protein